MNAPARHGLVFCWVVVHIAAAWAVPSAAGSVAALTHQRPLRFSYGAGALDDAGGQVFYASTESLTGDEPRAHPQIQRFDVLTEARELILDLDRGVVGAPSASDDGQWLAFLSTSDPLGTNADRSAELFVVRSDGTDLLQLTDHPATEAGTILEFAFAGSANRVAFIATTDPLGSNPSHMAQVFVVNRDGTGLAQLTSHAVEGARGVAVSDDGTRIAYEYPGDPFGANPDMGFEIFVILADGTGHRQLTSGADGDSTQASVSGNGARVAFVSTASLANPNPSGSQRLHVVDWDGTGLLQLTGTGILSYIAASPSITDDASVVFYASDEVTSGNLDGSFEVWRIQADGSGAQQLTATPEGNSQPVAAGGGGRIVFTTGGAFPGGLNMDGGRALISTDDAGGAPALVAEEEVHVHSGLDLTPSASRVVFVSNLYDAALNPDRLFQVHRVAFDGSDSFQVTQLTDGDVSALGGVTDDGGTIVFSATADPVGSNPSHGTQIFVVEADGSNLRQLTPEGTELADVPAVAGNGSWVVFQSTDDLTGGNPDRSGELFRVRLDGTGLAQITDDDDGTIKIPRVDRSGTWVVYQSAGDPLGTNTDGSIEIFRVRTDGTGLQQITDDPSFYAVFPDIAAAGDRIVYSSEADPLGDNPEHNGEIFFYDVATATVRQLTRTTSGDSTHPRISRDGSWVYFKSTAPFFGESAGYEPYRLHLDTGLVERAGGLGDLGLGAGSFRSDMTIVPDEDGNQAVFQSYGDRDGSNPDQSSELFAVDDDAPAAIQVSKVTPTVVSWTAEPQFALYDVIRGDLAGLAAAGEMVDLGPVVCLEDDSRDNTTQGNEDPEEPLPGQGFFFLYRGSQGPSDPPGPWGFGTGGKERVPASGACP